MSKSKSKSDSRGGKIEFLHDIKQVHIENGHKTVLEEHAIKGSKGVLIKYYSKDGDKKEKYVIVIRDGNIILKQQHGEEKSETTMTKEELTAFLKKTKALKFAVDLLKQMTGGRRRRRGSKKSKKSSKRRSKRRSGGARKRRSSRKSKKSRKSKGGSRKRSRKSGGSRRRRSRKSSNGGSRRRKSKNTSGGKRRRSKSKKSRKSRK